jgi:hypothetical protein
MKAFASSTDLADKEQRLELLGDGVYALTAEGDPNVGAIEGEDFLVCFEAMATPVAARGWLERLREHTDKPVRYLVLSHYHAVRVLGASAFGADVIVAHDNTRALIAERGKQDWESELGRMPRLFRDPASIGGLTWPTATFSDRLTIHLGGSRGELVLAYCGRRQRRAPAARHRLSRPLVRRSVPHLRHPRRPSVPERTEVLLRPELEPWPAGARAPVPGGRLADRLAGPGWLRPRGRPGQRGA